MHVITDEMQREKTEHTDSGLKEVDSVSDSDNGLSKPIVMEHYGSKALEATASDLLPDDAPIDLVNRKEMEIPENSQYISAHLCHSNEDRMSEDDSSDKGRPVSESNLPMSSAQDRMSGMRAVVEPKTTRSRARPHHYMEY